MSSRNVIGVVGGQLRYDDKANTFDAATYLKQCQERRKIDPNYTEHQHKLDRSRIALKLPPNHVQPKVRSSHADVGEISSTMAESGTDFNDDNDYDDFDDTCLDDFDDLTSNSFHSDYHNAGVFSPDSSMGMMNLSTLDSQSSFFF